MILRPVILRPAILCPAIGRRAIAHALVVASLLAALSGAAPATADVRYIAYGDSITRGNDCSVNDTGDPDSIFDGDGPGCAPNVPCEVQTQDDKDGCGYAWRLEDDLVDGGIDATVVNAASAGERTPNGLTRLDDWIATTDDVLLLMEGTNDVSKLMKDDRDAILPAVIRDNLQEMIAKATAKGLDTVLATVIERVCPTGFPRNCPGPTPQANPNEEWTDALNNKLRRLGPEIGRAVVFPDDVLCRGQSCVNSKYWRHDIKFGHLDQDGYDTLAPVFAAPILAAHALAAPNLVAPEGATLDQPVFEWDELDGAVFYHLQVETDDGTLLTNDWHEASTVCSGGACSMSLSSDLDLGAHAWRVQGKNLRGRGPWAPWRDFSVRDVPAVPVLLSPPPDVFDPTPPLRPTYSWNESYEADSYRLIVERSGAPIVDEMFDAASVCTGGTCSARPAALPGAGEYRFKVRASNPAAASAFSPPNDFIAADDVPAVPSLIGPSPDTFQADPTYRWSKVAGATEYDLQVDGGAVTSVSADAVCGETQCSVRLGDNLSRGSHSWRARGSNPLGNGAWTPIADFEVLACAPGHLVLGPADVGTGSVFAACFSITATDGFVINAGENVTLHAGDEVILQSGFTSIGKMTVRIDP